MKLFFGFLCIFLSHETFSMSSDLGVMTILLHRNEHTVLTIFDFNPMKFNNPVSPFHFTIGKSFWKNGAIRCPWRNMTSTEMRENRLRVTATAYCPNLSSGIYLDMEFLNHISPEYNIFGRVLIDNRESTFILSKKQRSLRINPPVDPLLNQMINKLAHFY